jgi:hypothetical protein
MELDRPNVKTCFPLYRLEWSAISGHGNAVGEEVPEELRGLIFEPGDSHEHSCIDHVSSDRQIIRKGGVHAARKIEPDFDSYDDALRYVCDTLKIENREAIPASGIQWPLFT